MFIQQTHRLCSSGLYSAANFVHIGINGSNLDLPINLSKFKKLINNQHTDEFETLLSLYNFAKQNPKYKILYMHTKGITNHQNSLSVLSWRLYLEYFNIDKWQECLMHLDNYDCVGVEGLFNVLDTRNPKKQNKYYNGHYAGNFWWANSEYVARLDSSYLQLEHRGKPGIRELGELWIGTQQPKYYNFMTSKYEGRFLYESIISPDNYIEVN